MTRNVISRNCLRLANGLLICAISLKVDSRSRVPKDGEPPSLSFSTRPLEIENEVATAVDANNDASMLDIESQIPKNNATVDRLDSGETQRMYPGAYAVEGPDPRGALTRDISTSSPEPPTHQNEISMYPVSAQLVRDNETEAELRQRVEQLERMQRNQQNIVAAEVIVDNNEEPPRDVENKPLNRFSCSFRNSKRKWIGFILAVVLVGVGVALGVVLPAMSSSLCPPGYSGEKCDTNIDDCDPYPCLNGGSCIDGVNEYTCDCSSGYSGDSCETNIDDCTPTCRNGGTWDACDTNINPVPTTSVPLSGIWTSLGDAALGGGGADDWLGFSVSLSSDGNTVAAGATQYHAEGNPPGYVRIYEWNGSTWSQLGNDISGVELGEEFGHKVSLSANGNILAVGAPASSVRGSQSGLARVFEWDGSVWAQLGDDINGDTANDYLGHPVSLSADGSIVALGAPRWSVQGVTGYARVYKWNGSVWNRVGRDINGRATGGNFGTSVSLSADGKVLAVSDDQSSYLRIFEWNSCSWETLGNDIDGVETSDSFGTSVSLSADGNTVAVGASRWSFEGSTEPGYARVYAWNGTAWNQLGGDLNGSFVGDTFGHSVSLSADGAVVAVGTNSGYVSVFGWAGSEWKRIGNNLEGVGSWSISLSDDGTTLAIGDGKGGVEVMQLAMQ